MVECFRGRLSFLQVSPSRLSCILKGIMSWSKCSATEENISKCSLESVGCEITDFWILTLDQADLNLKYGSRIHGGGRRKALRVLFFLAGIGTADFGRLCSLEAERLGWFAEI